MKNIIDSLVEVRLKESEDFLKVKETLTRIGIASKKENRLYQSCHILHKQGKYYIVHFKELFAMDGKVSDFSIEDEERRNTIAMLLNEWGLVQVVKVEAIKDNRAPLAHIKVIPFGDKSKWELVTKYSIGRKKV